MKKRIKPDKITISNFERWKNMSQKLNVKEVYWGRSYPMRLENEQLVLVRKNSAYKLIYEAFLQENNESIGTCHVMEKVDYKAKCKNKPKGSECKAENEKFVVLEYVAKSNKLRKRLSDIQKLIRERI